MSRGQFVDWGSSDTHLMLNPKLPEAQRRSLSAATLPYLPSHIWIASSGASASSGLKLYALSKSAFLISAASVNAHLDARKTDIWLNVLPHFHVGGLSIYARAYVSHSKIIDRSAEAWSAEKFIIWVNDSQATITSLVPTQIFDLLKSNCPAPVSLRAIVVGGAQLESDLYLRARAAGYPILPSYGMTECCSQIATANLCSLSEDQYPRLEVLSHIEVKKMAGGHLAIKSSALFTAHARWCVGESEEHLEVLWRAGTWYVTEDLGEITGDVSKISGRNKNIFISPRGRDNGQIKILGELVDLHDLATQFKNIVEDDCKNEFCVISQADSRRGAEVVLVLRSRDYHKANDWVLKFNSKVLPIAKIRAVYFVDSLPKSDLGKIRIGELKDTLGI